MTAMHKNVWKHYEIYNELLSKFVANILHVQSLQVMAVNWMDTTKREESRNSFWRT